MVEVSNLHRQIIHTSASAGGSKALSAAEAASSYVFFMLWLAAAHWSCLLFAILVDATGWNVLRKYSSRRLKLCGSATSTAEVVPVGTCSLCFHWLSSVFSASFSTHRRIPFGFKK